MNGSYTVATLMQTLFLEDAPAVAQQTGFQKRASKLGPDQFAQAVVMGLLADPDSSLDELAQTAAQVNAPVSAPGHRSAVYTPSRRVLQGVAAPRGPLGRSCR